MEHRRGLNSRSGCIVFGRLLHIDDIMKTRFRLDLDCRRGIESTYICQAKLLYSGAILDKI